MSRSTPPAGSPRSWRSVPGYAAPGYTTSATTAPTTATTTVTPTATPTPPPGAVTWYDCSWTHRKNITIDKTKVVGSVSNFPVLINFSSDSDLKANARANGFDIFFTDSDGVTKLPHQIEYYSPGTGGLTAWVKVPSLSSAANTSIYMYYGKPGSVNMEDKTNVWDANYMAVWHLNESGTGAANEFKDSTSNNNNGQGGAGVGGQTPTQTPGKIGFGQLFARASSKFIQVTDNPGSLDPTTGLTLEGWANGASWLSGNSTIIGKQYGAAKQDTYAIAETLLAGPSSVAAGYLTSGDPRGGSPGTGTWYFYAMNYSSSGTATAYMFLNGAVVDSQAGLSISTDGNPVLLGAEEQAAAPAQFFDGTVDELRISNVARSDAWIATEYNNQNSPTTFEYVRPQESDSCAPAFVQGLGINTQSGNTANITLPGPSTAGNLMVLSLSTATTAVTVSSITDTKGNTYTPAIGPTDWNAGADRSWTYYASNIAGGGPAITITITYSGGAPPSLDTYAAEYSGVTTGSPLDQTSAGTGLAGINLDSGSKTTTQASELIFGFGMSAGHAIPDVPYAPGRSTFDNNFIADQTVASINSYHVTATNTGANNWMCQMVTFKGA